MPKQRHWCFTLNNPSKEEYPKFTDQFIYLTYQLERGQNGTEHLQGFFTTNREKSQSEAKALVGNRAHIEASRSEAAIAYCHKEESRIDGPWEFGKRIKKKESGKRSDLHAATELIRSGKRASDLAILQPETYVKYYRGLRELERAIKDSRRINIQPRVEVFIGSSGTGKSRLAYERYPNCYVKVTDNKWWDGYDGQREVLFDDWSGCNDISPTALLSIVDRYPRRIEFKGGSCELLANVFIFTTNVEIDFWYKDTKYYDIWENHSKAAFMRRLNEDGEIKLFH